MTKTFGVADAKARLSELIRQVEMDGGSVVIERRGRPVVMLVPYDESVQAQPRNWVEALRGAAAEIDDFDEIMEDVLASRRRASTRPMPDFDGPA